MFSTSIEYGKWINRYWKLGYGATLLAGLIVVPTVNLGSMLGYVDMPNWSRILDTLVILPPVSTERMLFTRHRWLGAAMALVTAALTLGTVAITGANVFGLLYLPGGVLMALGAWRLWVERQSPLPATPASDLEGGDVSGA